MAPGHRPSSASSINHGSAPALDLFARYRARLSFREKLVGGIPKDPRLIESWLRARAGIDDREELRQALLRTITEVGSEDVGDGLQKEVLGWEQITARKLTTGFKHDEQGLYIEPRQVKALMKECTNILFGGERWGVTRKGPKSFLAERVFIEPERLYLGAEQPSDLELIVGHHNTIAGVQSTLSYHEYVLRPDIEFSVLVVRDLIAPAQWAELWALAEQIGLGSVRSQGYGRFRLVAWQLEG